MEKFERVFGSWFGTMSVLWIPIPFVGIFLLPSALLFIIAGFLFRVNDPIAFAHQSGIFFAAILGILFLIGIVGMIKYGNYKKVWPWIRLALYLIGIFFYLGFYLLSQK